MKRPLRSLAPALVLAALALPRPAAAITCDEIMNMVNVNVPVNIVVQTMRDSGDTFDKDDLACLRAAGAPDAVIAQAERQAASSEPVPMPDDEAEPMPRSSFDDDEDIAGSRRAPPKDVDLSDGPSTSGAPPSIEDAISEYQSKRYLASSLRLYEALESGAYPDSMPDIHYYLARNLEALEMYHTAQYHYLWVVKKARGSQYFDYALPRLVAIAEFTGDDTELASLVRREGLSPESYPRQAKDHLYFLLGTQLYRDEDLRGAREAFAQVGASTVLGLKAKYLEGVIANEQGKLKSAVRAFRDVYREEVDPRTDREAAELVQLKDMALINTARIYYSIERFDEANTYYDMVARDSSYWGTALFENAWATFMLNDLNKSLGLLLTVRSPFFREDEFLPEATVLRALTYFNLCEYERVEKILLGFEDDYRPMYEEMRDFVEQYSGNEGKKMADQAWDAYFGRERRETVLPKAVFDRILRNQDLQGVVRHLELMDAEQALVDGQKAQWADTLGPYLKEILEKDRERLKRRAGILMLREMARQANFLNEQLTQSEIIRFEVVDAQRVDYQYKASNVELQDSAGSVDLDFATAVDWMYWPFNGEYWSDELGYYEYTEQGSCN